VPGAPLILAYHGVGGAGGSTLRVEPEQFEFQMRHLSTHNLRGSSLEQMDSGGAHPPSPGSVGLTFDDGYEDNYRVALPILQTYGFTATVFLVTDYVGTDRPLEHDRLAGRSAETSRLVSWSQVREMADLGFRFGSHTCTHPDLTRLDDGDLERELEASKHTIEDRTGRAVEYFCYPEGWVDERVIRAVEAAGYRGAVLTPHSPRFHRDTPFTRIRTGVYRHTSPVAFRIKTSSGYQRAVRSAVGFRLIRRLSRKEG